jgi:hypothetical protein
VALSSIAKISTRVFPMWSGEVAILNGWKEIAKYLGRGVRTSQRWESIGLPIRRPHGHNRSTVMALSEEIDLWLHRAVPYNRDIELALLKSRAEEALKNQRMLIESLSESVRQRRS